MARRVAEVQDTAQAALALVLGHHPRLDTAGVRDHRGQRLLLAPHDGAQVATHALEQATVGDHAVLDHLVEAGPELAPRERAEHLRIGEDRKGLVERADQVLAEGMIDAHLAADRAVHLREQRGGYVHEPDAAQIGRRRKADDVADHAAPIATMVTLRSAAMRISAS